MLPGQQASLETSAAAAVVLELHLLVPEDTSGTHHVGWNQLSRNNCVSRLNNVPLTLRNYPSGWGFS